MNAVIYARFSSINQNEESIAAQARACRNYATQNGFNITHIYTDEALSAKNDNRPQFQQMIKDAEAGLFEIIIIHKLDRFSRDRYDSAIYKRRLKIANVRLISVLERIDDSPESSIMESLLEGLSEYYSLNLAREVMKGLNENAYKCKHTGGSPPLGYCIGKDMLLQIEPNSAQAVRIIFDMYSRDCGYSAILDKLSIEGFKTQRGQAFGKNSLHDILTNEKYIGVYTYNKSAKKGTNGKRNTHKKKDDADIIRIEAGCPAIIDINTWGEVQKRMKDNTKRARTKADTVYLLSGILYCGICGAAMVAATAVNGRGYQYSYYQCGNRKRTRTCNLPNISTKIIEPAVVAHIASLLKPDSLERIATKALGIFDAWHKDSHSDIQTSLKQQKALQGKLGRIIDMLADGEGVKDELLSKAKDLKTELNNIVNKINSYNAAEKTKGEFTKEFILKQFDKYADLERLPPERQKEIIQKLVKRIEVFPSDKDGYKLKIKMDGFVLDIKGCELAPPLVSNTFYI